MVQKRGGVFDVGQVLVEPSWRKSVPTLLILSVAVTECADRGFAGKESWIGQVFHEWGDGLGQYHVA